jgi:undecaprenyl-phosphate galactose phosphotransferase
MNTPANINIRKNWKIRNAFEQFVMLGLDVVFIYISFKLARLIRLSILPELFDVFPKTMPFNRLLEVWWILPVWIFFFIYEDIYSNNHSVWDEAKTIFKVTLFATVGVFVIVSIGRLSTEVSRTLIVLMGILSLPIHITGRYIGRKILRRAGFFKRNVLILGAGETGTWILDALISEVNVNYRIRGFLDDDPSKTGTRINGINVLGTTDMADDIIKIKDITDIFIAMPKSGTGHIQDIINNLQHKVSRTFIVPELTGVAVLGVRLHHFTDHQAFALEVKNNLDNMTSVIIKRAFDITMSLLILPIILIPMLLIIISIKLDSRGPATLSQERIGRKNKLFKCYKFRTMYQDADSMLIKILESDPEARKEWEEGWKLKDDPRITKIGKYLRRGYLDELPQIFNVMIGNMSFVGPRPYLPREEERIKKYADKILLTPPGITGLWQVSGRQSNEYRIHLDLWYIRNWNLWLDIIILFKTAMLFIVPSSSPYRK